MALQLTMHNAYERIAAKAQASHKHGRGAEDITDEDVILARLYSYAFRVHTIGAYHATREALQSCERNGSSGDPHLQRAIETLEDLANMGMESIPEDFRALISTFYRYDRNVRRAVDAIQRASNGAGDATMVRIGERFCEIMGEITSGNGIHLTRDDELPDQANFIVPSLGISIVPLVYGDNHSWNLAYLKPDALHVPDHRHHQGVEIHLGYDPLEGYMVRGDYKALVNEGYALAVPPLTRHGWVNTSGHVHHLPFVFGSLKQAGWGVFLDVDPQPIDLDALETVDRQSWKMPHTVYLNREINALSGHMGLRRQILIPASATDRDGGGGLELTITRIGESGFDFPVESFRTVSVVHGRGLVKMGPVERAVEHRDHFGVPKGLIAFMQQEGNDPLIVLDAVIKRAF